MGIYDKYSGGINSFTNKIKPFKNIQFGVVINSGPIPVITNGKENNDRDLRYNADRHAIRVRIIGSRYDNGLTDNDLPNCFPLLPKHLNFTPKEGEMVMVVMFGEKEKTSDRFYFGSFISSELNMNKDTMSSTASANLIDSFVRPGEEILKIPSAKGVYENPKHVTIEGRENTDIIQKNGEILLRAGKFILNTPNTFNNLNPGYIQIKFNQTFNEQNLNQFGVADNDNISKGTTKKITITNIVSDKINFLTYGKNNDYDLTNRDKASDGAAKYITDDEMNKILNEAHPMVFGDVLIEYLQLLKDGLLKHIHQINQPGHPNTYPENFQSRLSELEKSMLSKNIRIN